MVSPRLVALVVAAVVLSCGVATAKLPRGFNSEMYCSACEKIVKEFNDEIDRADDTKQLETGSYRVDGDGKQRWKKKIPYKRSALHIETVFDTVCVRMSNDYRKALSGDFFVRKDDAETKNDTEDADVDEDHKSKYQLTSLCQTFVDENLDDMIGVLQKPMEPPQYSSQICGTLLKACESDESSAEEL